MSSWLTSIWESVDSTAQEAWTGHVSDIDKQQILDNTNASIAMASGGADPGTISANQTAAAADINAALNSFSINGDKGGAQPNNDLHLPGNISLSPASIEWIAIGVGALVILAVAFPALAPLIGSDITAALSLKKAAR